MQYPIELRLASELKPDPRNSRTHTQEQIEAIKRLILTVGFTQPILADEFIIAGHARTRAALELMDEGHSIHTPGLKDTLPPGTLPVVDGSGMSEAERRAYVIADNRVAQLAGWDSEILASEIADLKAMDFDLSLTGFDPLEIGGYLRTGGREEPENPYTRKIQSPVYEVTGAKPKVEQLLDTTRRDELLAAIAEAKPPAEVRRFLEAAAARHVRFDFEQIAEFYAHAPAKVQHLMEDSALVIIDFDRAVELGFVRLTEELEESYRQDYPDGE